MWFSRRENRREGASSGAGRAAHLQLGALGERLAVEHLKRNGYRIVATNFTAPLGRSLRGRAVTGEIDIIAYDEKTPTPTLIFIEVKTRSRADIALPEAAVDRRKQRQIARTAHVYRRMLLLEDEPYRYDVVSIIVGSGRKPEVMLLTHYFSDSVFRRARWFTRND